MREFVGRKNELALLKKEYNADYASLTIIFGRRRIGKTTLIEEFIKNKKAIYYLAADEPESAQINELKSIISAQLNDPVLKDLVIPDWKTLFEYLERQLPKDKKTIIVLDEVTYLTKRNKSFVSYLQQMWDKHLIKKNVMLILCGSIVSLVLEEILSKKSPLYGRRTAEISLGELSVFECALLFQDIKFEELLKYYFVFGGVPKYLEVAKAASNGDFDQLMAELFSPRSFFYREGYYLLSEEFNDPSTYLVILRAISFGYTKSGEIADYVGLDSRRVSAYLEILQDLGFIVRRLPISEKEKSRKGLYYLNDNFLCFWSRFIWPNKSLIEIDRGNEVLKVHHNEINAFFGLGFEKFAKKTVLMSGRYERIGSQWGSIPNAPKDQNQYEIDIFAINEKAGECLFGECKWQSGVDAAGIAKALAIKSGYVDWKKDTRKEVFAVFAKSFAKRTTQTGNTPVQCFDLKDLEHLMKKDYPAI